MRLAVNHAYFFPYLGYFQVINAVNRYLLYEHFDYIKDGWMHRNRLQGRNHAPFNIAAHVSGRSSRRRISEIELVETRGWRKKLKKSLVQNYRGASFFEETYALTENLMNVSVDTLHGFNSTTIRGICEHLEIRTEIVSRNDAYLEMENTLGREVSATTDANLAPKVQRLLHICRHEGATMYVNAIGGIDLYREAQFTEAGIDLRFVKTLPHSYQQFGDDFLPNLSILDVLMFCGRDGTRRLLQQYELIESCKF